jgi:hypothetical protein
LSLKWLGWAVEWWRERGAGGFREYGYSFERGSKRKRPERDLNDCCDANCQDKSEEKAETKNDHDRDDDYF